MYINSFFKSKILVLFTSKSDIKLPILKCYYNSYLDTPNEYSLNVSLIPSSRKSDCPINSKYRARFGVCSCDSHCSWDLCRAIDAPDSCLLGTEGNWTWDQNKYAWVAQIVKGIKYIVT